MLSQAKADLHLPATSIELTASRLYGSTVSVKSFPSPPE
jgi:hypothetical protein